MTDGEHLLEAQHQQEVRESWAFRTASYVFQRNCQECLDYLYEVEHDPKRVLPLAKDHGQQEEVAREVVRLVANCVGAAVSLQHSVKTLHGRIHEDGTFPEFWAERKRRYEDDGLIQFVIRLRGFLVHVRPVAIMFSFSMPDLQDMSTWSVRLGIDPVDLVKDAKRWRGPGANVARCYMDDFAAQKAKDRPSLFQLLVSFLAQVNRFYGWFAQRENELRKARLALFHNVDVASPDPGLDIDQEPVEGR